MKIFEVDIAGSGTKDEIVASLLELVKTIKNSDGEADVVAEDVTLYSELTKADE